VHRWTTETDRLSTEILDYARRRLQADPVALGGPRTPAELEALAGQTITEAGIGGDAALRLFDDVLAKACISVDHPRFLSFIPGAPSNAAALFDLAVGVSSIYGGSWLEGAGAVYAENQALRWLADLAGFPAGAGGVFVQGGTLGNLSALVTARHVARARRVGAEPRRWRVAITRETHSSVAAAAAVMDTETIDVPTDADGRLTGPLLERALAEAEGDGLFAVVASAGTTNLGIVDDLESVAAVCAERGVWLHVDGAYGAAALAAPSVRPLFAGIERCDSFIVDPHKWLFAPFDSCALVYRDPSLARAAHTQQAGYLEALQALAQWDPSDYAFNLSRRARGLPFWFSLAAHGTQAYVEAIEGTLSVARAAAEEIRARPYLELVREPDLTVVAFRRLGWSPADYDDWSRRIRESGFAFVLPTVHEGETITRFAIVNPRTTPADIAGILDSMAGG
jgi:glutamate/tyrosine decarboxylase-like PLP-dependent enzyme